MEEGCALKVAQQFVILGLAAYETVAYKKTKDAAPTNWCTVYSHKRSQLKLSTNCVIWKLMLTILVVKCLMVAAAHYLRWKFVISFYSTKLNSGCAFSGLLTSGEDKKTPFSKTYHTYPTMMKHRTVIPNLKRSKKWINHVIQSLHSAGISIFSPEIRSVCCIRTYR